VDKVKYLLVFCWGIVMCLNWNLSSLGAQESGQKKYGVIFNIAEDRKVEKVGGIYEPEGLDKYVRRRFDAVDERLDSLEKMITDLKSELLKAIEESKKKEMSILVS
jgi:hypothetical protein